MRNFAITGATQKKAFDASLSRKALSLKMFDMQTVSGLLPRLFFGRSIEARRF